MMRQRDNDLDFKSLSIDDWVERFHDKGSRRIGNKSAYEIWLYSVENAALVAKYVRREEWEKTVKSLGRAFGLMCAFVKKFNEETKTQKLSVMFWNKYPGLCRACIHKVIEGQVKDKRYQACQCSGMKGKPPPDKYAEQINTAKQCKKRPKSIDQWAKMIRKIYEARHSDQPMSAICLHFIEEIGEITKELYEIQTLKEKQENITKLEDEIADVCSWIFGLLNKIDQNFTQYRKYYKETSRGTQLPPLKISNVITDAYNQFMKKQAK